MGLLGRKSSSCGLYGGHSREAWTERPSPERVNLKRVLQLDTWKLLTWFVTGDILDTSKDAAEHMTERDGSLDELSDVTKPTLVTMSVM